MSSFSQNSPSFSAKTEGERKAKFKSLRKVMNDLSNAALLEHQSSYSCKPIPKLALYILPILFLLGLSVSVFILVVVRNATFFLALLLLSALVASFVAWNVVQWRQSRAAISFFLRSFPDSNLGLAREGQLIKITGVASCGNISLESSYERVSRCIYSSTLLFEYGRLGLKPVNVDRSCFKWSLMYCERYSTDFYITDQKSGLRAMVKAGSGSRVVPLVTESELVTTTKQCRMLSAYLRRWLRDRNLSTEPRLLRLQEGYIQEGGSVTIVGMLRKSNDTITIVQPPELISTGCLWRRMLLPIEIDGLILGTPHMATIQHPEQQINH